MDENEKNYQDDLRSQLFRNSFKADRGYRSAINLQSDLNSQLNSSIQGGLQRRAEASENRKRRQIEADRLATDAGLRRRELDMRNQAFEQQGSVLGRLSTMLSSMDKEQQ